MSDAGNLAEQILKEAKSVKDVDKADAVGLRTYFSKLEREEISRLKKLVSNQEEELEVYSNAKRCLAFLDGVETPKSTRIAFKRFSNPKAFQLHLSDTHSRELVSKSLTSGRNEHSPEIGSYRMASIVDQAISQIKIEAMHCDPVHFTVWGGGDWMVNADLHYKMERCVDDEPLVEMQHVYELLSENLRVLFSGSPCDSNSFVGSFSNHGRDTEKITPGLEAARSYDTHVYRRLEKDFPEVRFIVAETPWTIEEICGFRTCYTHGHSKKSSVRRAAGGIMVPNWKFLMEHRETYKFDAYVQGHHHVKSILWSDKLAHIQNGSLVGENTYSHSEGFPPEPASQNLVVIDLKRSVVEKVIALYPQE